MAKSKKKSETVFLVCKETGDYNYSSSGSRAARNWR